MRSLLFVPGNKANMLEKASAHRPDALVPDMEDSVTEAEKPAARDMIATWIPRLAATDRLLLPRVNDLRSEWFAEDILAVTRPEVWGVSIGKVDSADDIRAIAAAMHDAEQAEGMEPGSLRLVPWLESARAIVECFSICTASERIAAVAYGGEDYTNDLGIERLDDESNTLFARSSICNAARAAGIPALETPWFRFRDQDGLRDNSLAAKRIGFKGRFAIHPAQIDTINACFSPGEAELEEARRIVAAFDAAAAKGRGSTSLDGRVIDVPVVRRARALLALTDSSG